MRPELTPQTLLWAYANGAFPMDVYGQIMWFSPDPRCVIELDTFHVPRSLRQVCRQGRFEIRLNGQFPAVIRACAGRPEGTWISEPIIAAYTELHRLGFVHSVEAYRDGQLAGGLYGVALHGAFFGESMFHLQSDASKVCLVYLVDHMRERGLTLLDAQWRTAHLARFGAVEIPRRQYLRRLARALRRGCRFTEATPLVPVERLLAATDATG